MHHLAASLLLVACASSLVLHVEGELRSRRHTIDELNSGSSKGDVSMCHGHSDWQVTFEDLFNGNTLNSSNWIARDNFTHGPTEKELYVASAVTVANGAMTIKTQKEHLVDKQGKAYGFSSGYVDSKELKYQKFGRFEIRAKLPAFTAHKFLGPSVGWPAHWMMPNPSTSQPKDVCWPVGGEIDIMEMMGGTDIIGEEKMDMTYHWADQCGKDLWGANPKTQGHIHKPKKFWDSEFHTYGVEWTSSSLSWFLDGEKLNELTAGTPKSLFIPQNPFYMILNTAIESKASATQDSGFPLYHVIDRVTWCEKK